MIPASSFLLDGDTALVVVESLIWVDHDLIWEELNRPCDTCGGSGVAGATSSGLDGYQRCSDCDGTGRWTFDIEVLCPLPMWNANPDRPDVQGSQIRTFRVRVIDVLPIRGGAPSDPPWTAGERLVHVMSDASAFIVTARGDGHGASDVEQRITLPSAAEPGMLLVRLAVHQ